MNGALRRSGVLIWAGAALALTQTPRFSSGTEAVRVDVLVSEGGRPVRGLEASDFEVLDNGVRQQIDHVSFEELPLNVVLTLDMSDSLVGDRLTHLKDAAVALLDGLKKDDRAALISFSHVVTARASLTSDLSRVRTGIAQADASGQTALVDAAFTGMMVGEADVGRGLLIIFSDGIDTASWLAPDAVLDIAKRTDVVVYGVATGESRRSPFLQSLASFTGGKLFDEESTENLRTVFLAVLEEFRHRYLVTYAPRGVTKGGWHRLDVRVRNRRATVKARPGYLGGA